MREIKFRGQCKITKDFVVGDLIHGVGNKAGKMFILPINKNLAYVKHCHPLDGVEVIPETIGQFTGLKDKNGVEIYDGDLFKDNLDDENDTYVIIQLECGRYALKRICDDYIDEFIDWKYTEVIGNIHQNPELL